MVLQHDRRAVRQDDHSGGQRRASRIAALIQEHALRRDGKGAALVPGCRQHQQVAEVVVAMTPVLAMHMIVECRVQSAAVRPTGAAALIAPVASW